MGATSEMTLRVVLDTNIVLSALVFSEGRLSWIRNAWRGGKLRPVVCRETVSELMRALAYPKFRLTASEIEELLADFLPYAEVVEFGARRPEGAPDVPPGIPKCRDPGDLVFLQLARVAKVRMLVTGDNDLLALRGKFPVPIVTAEEMRRCCR